MLTLLESQGEPAGSVCQCGPGRGSPHVTAQSYEKAKLGSRVTVYELQKAEAALSCIEFRGLRVAELPAAIGMYL
jgi:hypothetical protein